MLLHSCKTMKHETLFLRKTRVTRNRAGFTMIEVLIAMVILTVGLAGTATLVASLIRGTQMSRHVTAATTLCQDKVEAFKNSTYSSVASGSESNINARGQAGGAYTRTWTVTEDATTSTKTIVVSVTWPFNGVTKTRTMTTAITQ